MTLTEITLLATTGASGLGWLLTHLRSKRLTELDGDLKEIESLRKIIEEQDVYIKRTNERMGAMEKHFDEKCAQMQLELETLKKKVTK